MPFALVGRAAALLERLQGHDEEGGIRLGIIVDEVQADDRSVVLNGMFLRQDLLGLFNNLGGARDGCAAGQLRDDEEGALVVFRQEAGRRDFRKPDNAEHGSGDENKADDRDADEPRHGNAISVTDIINGAHHPADDAAPRPMMRLQEDGAERGRERERVDRGQEHSHRDGHGELAEKLARDAGYEGNGHENRQAARA